MSAAGARTGRRRLSGEALHEATVPAFAIRLRDLREVPRRDLYIRFAFGAGISIAASIIGLGAGSRFGGIFLAFPAILPATLTLLEKENSKRTAKNDVVGSVFGAAALIVFGLLTWLLVGARGAPIGLAAASLAWLATAVLLYLSLRSVVRRVGGHHSGSTPAARSRCGPGRPGGPGGSGLPGRR